MRAAALVGLGLMLSSVAARAEALLVLTRDGALQRVDGAARLEASFAAPRALAVLDGKVVVAAEGRLIVLDGGRRRVVPGRHGDLRFLVAARRLFAVTDGGALLAVDLERGARRPIATRARVDLVASDGREVYSEHAGAIERVGSDRSWKVPGRPIALAVAPGKLYVATHEGPLWEIDLSTDSQRDLGLGGWWGTLALVAAGGKLYAATQSGKLWQIDPAAGTKTALAMSGWEGTLAVAVAPEARDAAAGSR
jgi:hypothetical protein